MVSERSSLLSGSGKVNKKHGYARSLVNGNATIRLAALAVGIVLNIDCMVCLFSNLFDGFHIVYALIDFYGFCFGATAVLMEVKREAVPAFASKFHDIVGKNIEIVRTVAGRGLFYIVAGSLEIAQGTFTMEQTVKQIHDSDQKSMKIKDFFMLFIHGSRSTSIGFVMILVALLYICLGHQAEIKLKKRRNKDWPEWKVKETFKKNADFEGGITLKDFFKLLRELGVEVSMPEAELMYLSLEKDRNLGVKYDEFQRFWSFSSELNSFNISVSNNFQTLINQGSEVRNKVEIKAKQKMNESSSLINAGRQQATRASSKFLSSTFSIVKELVQGNTTIRLITMFVGVVLVIDCLVCFFTNLFSLQIVFALMNVFALCFGGTVVLVESDQTVAYAFRLRAILRRNVKVLTVTWRCLFYGVAGTLEIAQTSHFFSQIIGYIMIFTAVLYVYLGYRAELKLKAFLQSEVWTEMKLKAMFKEYGGGESRISLKVFFKLLQDLDIDLGMQESWLMHLSLDKIRNHGLDYEEFQGFWSYSPDLNASTFSIPDIKLKNIRKVQQELSPRRVKQMFQKLEVDSNGRITFNEFYKLIVSLKVDVTMQEAEVMYLSMGKNKNLGINYEEFENNWSNLSRLDSFCISIPDDYALLSLKSEVEIKIELERRKKRAKEAASFIFAYAKSVVNENSGIRVMTLTIGIVLIVDSLVCFFGNLFGFHIVYALINFYAFCFGVTAVLMEITLFNARLRAAIGKNINIVRTVVGRGLFYIVAGSLEVAQGTFKISLVQTSRKLIILDYRSTAIGYAMLLIAILYIFLGSQAETKLKNHRNQVWPERKVKQVFKKYDVDGGGISFEQFFKLLSHDLNVELSMPEAELMYLSLDKTSDHCLKYEEFQGFWLYSSELSLSTV